MQQFVEAPPAGNPFVTAFAARMATVKAIPDARREVLRAEAERVVGAQVYPAWKKAIALLEPLVGRATDDAGLWRFKDRIGRVCVLSPALYHDAADTRRDSRDWTSGGRTD